LGDVGTFMRARRRIMEEIAAGNAEEARRATAFA
jgi:hypothetical protein